MKIKSTYLLIIAIVMIVLSILLNVYNDSKIKQVDKDYISFEKVNEENQKSFIYPGLVDLDNNNFYIIYSKDNYYIIKSTIDLNKTRFDGKYTRVIGVSKLLNENDKNEIIKMHNDFYKQSQEMQISIRDFDSDFGLYYLEVDKIIDDTDYRVTYNMISRLFLEIGIVFIVLFVIGKIIEYKKQI